MGHDPLPDWPAYGFTYREREGFRWDVPVCLLSIPGSIGFLLVASFYRSFFSGTLPNWFHAQTATVRRSSQAANGPPRFILRIMM